MIRIIRQGHLTVCAALAVLALGSPSEIRAQTDYYNTDRNRPTRIEDAHSTELYAFEVKVAPLRIEQEESGGFSRWTFHPEMAYGIFPGAAIEVGVPIETLGDERAGVSSVELSAFYNLNVETLSLPALAVRADLDIPVDGDGGGPIPALTGIVSRTLPIGRLHLNGRYAFGDLDEESGEHAERWLAGAAVDHVLPLRALLLIGEVYAVGGEGAADPLWSAGAGVRYQLNPYLALDAGVGRSFAPERRWHLTLGSALHLGVRSLVRVPGGSR